MPDSAALVAARFNLNADLRGALHSGLSRTLTFAFSAPLIR